MKLLVVDDQGPVGEIISRIAKQGGWESIHTTASDDLASVITAENVTALLIDYALDGDPHSTRNGVTIAAELRAAGISIPIILFSGWPNLVDADRAKELDIVRVLGKPLSIQDLNETLDEADRRYRASQSAA